jgi:hypothetical protein
VIVLTGKKQPEKIKDKLPGEKIVYPTYDEVVKINKAVLGDQEALGQLPESIRKEIEEMAKHFKPRPKERIPTILDSLKELWEIDSNSDMRFGQLLLNFPFRKVDYRDKTSIEIYALEDTETLEAIREAIKTKKASLSDKAEK